MSHKKSKMDEKNTKKSLSEIVHEQWRRESQELINKHDGNIHAALREWMNIKKG